MIRPVIFLYCCILILFLSVTGCRTGDTASPYDEILSQPSFSAITDSIKASPRDARLYFRRAVLLNRNNYPEPALADFQKAWSLDKQEIYATGAGNILMEKKPDSAVIFLQQAIQHLPHSVMLKLALARVFETQGKTANALQVCEDILHNHPFQLNTLLLKADLLDKKQDWAESIATLEKAYSIAPRMSDIVFSLAYKYAQAGNPKVISFCDSLIKKDTLPPPPELYYFKGVYYYNTGNRTKALECFDLAIQQDYKFLDAYLEKGRILYEMKKYEGAFILLQRAASITPTFADAYYWMGKCQEAVGEREEARLNYERAYELDKSLTEAKAAAEKLVN